MGLVILYDRSIIVIEIKIRKLDVNDVSNEEFQVLGMIMNGS